MLSNQPRRADPLLLASRGCADHCSLVLSGMRLEGIQIGDIVEVDRLGRRFHALVTGNASGGLSIQPLDRHISYRSCRAHDVVAHWARRGRPRATNEPLEPSPLQLELDTTARR